MMDNLGNEVIIKVKEAIRAKLKEMNANNSDEIIDYIMLLVTTKKSTTELAKSIDFLMESNTDIFVKWLSTIIKRLQQVTVSTTEKKLSDNLQVAKEKKTNENYQNGDVLTYETSDKKWNDSDEDKEDILLKLNVEDENIQMSDGEKEEKSLPISHFVSMPTKYDGRKTISSSNQFNKLKQHTSFFPSESIKTKNNIQLNKKDGIQTSFNEVKNTSTNKDFKVNIHSELIQQKNEIFDSKRKRPRISINSDDEDDKNKNIRLKVPVTTKEIPKQITKELTKKCNRISMSQVIVVKKDIPETKKKMNMNDLIVPRVDHQRGALALDTAFKYIQQQIGATDKEIAVVKKWRDYAVDMLRSGKNV